jgi:hypothetical protein
MYNIKFANSQHAQVTYNFKNAKVLDEKCSYLPNSF